jgi:hypothetical protein
MVDSLHLFEILKSGDLSESQARVMTTAIQKAESDIALDVKTVMERQLSAFGDRLEARLEARFEARFKAIDVRFEAMETRLEAFDARADQRLAVGMAMLRTEIAESKAEILRWNFAFWVAQLAAIAAILKLLK